jgi:hypothetical protein
MSKKKWNPGLANIKKKDVGKYVRVWFDKIGHVDGVLVEFDEDKNSEPNHTVFLLHEYVKEVVHPSQITWKGDFIPPPQC